MLRIFKTAEMYRSMYMYVKLISTKLLYVSLYDTKISIFGFVAYTGRGEGVSELFSRKSWWINT